MRILIWLILLYVGYKVVKGIFAQRELPAKPAQPEEETFKDPVCGVYVTQEDAVIGKVEGERVYFCSMACLEKYRDNLEHKS